VTLQIHSVAVLWLSGTRELPRTLPKTRCINNTLARPSLSSGEQGEPRSAHPLVVCREMLKLSRRAASPVEAPWCFDARLTREELPMEPESGSEGSSTVEPVQVTRICTTTALLGAMLMHSIKRLASEADKAGRRPVIMLHYDLAASFWHREELPMPLLVACQATKSRPRASVAQHGQWGRRPRTAPRWRSTWPRWPASGRTRQSTIGFFGSGRGFRGLLGLPSTETPAQRDDTQDVNDFLTGEKGVSWVASVSASRSLLLVS